MAVRTLVDQDLAMFRHSAHVYDLLYGAIGKDYAAEATTLHALIQKRVPGATSLLDVACGTGGHLVHLRPWYDVVGLDIDPGMLDEARRRLPEETFVEGDMRRFQLARTFDVVTCLFSSIGYMSSERDLDDAVSTMVSHLRPGGVLVVDGWVRPDAWRDEEPVHLQSTTDGSVTVARMSRSRREGNKTFLDMHHLIGSLQGIDHVVDVHEMTLFEATQYEGAMQRAGLTAVAAIPSPLPGRDRYIGVTPAH
jgi:SAM-dependent methyltransferase